jgi:hypothetical protein
VSLTPGERDAELQLRGIAAGRRRWDSFAATAVTTKRQAKQGSDLLGGIPIAVRHNSVDVTDARKNGTPIVGNWFPVNGRSIGFPRIKVPHDFLGRTVLAKRETTRRGTLDNRLGVSVPKPRRIPRNDQSACRFSASDRAHADSIA